MKCNPRPDAPHGFDRTGSHCKGEYVCTCESWRPEDKPMTSLEDLERKLREIYVSEGTNYVQQAADLIAQLRKEVQAKVVTEGGNHLPPTPQAQRLSDAEVDAEWAEHDKAYAFVSSKWSFEAGVKFAETAFCRKNGIHLGD